MPTYQYKARDQAGRLIEGVMAGDTESAVADKLKQMGYIPVLVDPAKGAPQVSRFFNRLGGVTLTEVNMFTRQLFVLQKAGLPLLSSLNLLKGQTTNKTLVGAIAQTQRDIEAGSKLSEAFDKHPDVFNALYVNMIEAGETSGKLSEVLERLAILGEHEAVIRLRIKEAVRYPSIVVVTIIIAFIVLITFVVPRFEAIFSRFGADLPLPTQILLGVHYVATKFWWLLLAVVLVLIFLFRRFINTKKGRLWWNAVQLKIPIFGPLMLKLSMSRFGRISGMLIRSGVPILQVLDLLEETVGNVVIAEAVDNIKSSVSEGNGMSSAMQKSNLFPPLVTQMVAVGEQTGKLDELLLHVADYYDIQVDHTIKNLVSLIEPLLILFLGGFVLLMALGIFLPMWRMIHVLRG